MPARHRPGKHAQSGCPHPVPFKSAHMTHLSPTQSCLPRTARNRAPYSWDEVAITLSGPKPLLPMTPATCCIVPSEARMACSVAVRIDLGQLHVRTGPASQVLKESSP